MQKKGIFIVRELLISLLLKPASRGSWSILSGPTYDTLGKGSPHQCGQSQVANFDWSRGARDEDVVTFEVPMDDWRSPGVKEVKTLQDLSTPAPQNLGFHHFEAFQVAVQEKKI